MREVVAGVLIVVGGLATGWGLVMAPYSIVQWVVQQVSSTSPDTVGAWLGLGLGLLILGICLMRNARPR